MDDNRLARRSAMAIGATILFLLPVATAGLAAQQSQGLPCEELGRLLIGRAAQHSSSCTVSIPRSDIELALLGATLPEAAVVSTITFVESGTTTLAIGELALTQGERPRILRELRAAGFTLTALHRHTAGEAPEIVFAHFQGAGPDVRELSQRIRQVMGPPPRVSPIRSQAVVGEYGSVSGIPCVRLALEVGASESAVAPGPGYCGVAADTGLQVTVGGVELPGDAVPHRFGFRQTPDRTSAVVTASLVLNAGAIDGVLAVVAEGGFDVVALANDRLDEEPRTVTLHVQARGNALLLAETLRSALAVSQKPPGAAVMGSGGPVWPIL